MVGIVGIAATVGLTAVVWSIASKIQSVLGYWKKCRSETLSNAHGTKCSSWLEITGTDNTTPPTAATWFRVNDVIMGGKSTSRLSTDAQGRLVFSGTINTDGGGFASTRTHETCTVKVPPTATAVRLVVEGDGHLWKANLGLGHSLMDSNPTFSHDFLTQANTVTTHLLPLSGFCAQKRGQTLQDVALEDPSQIAYVGLILSLVTQDGKPNPHFGDGPFKVVLHEFEFVEA